MKPKCPSIDKWVKNMYHIYTDEYYSSIKNSEILPFATAQNDPEGIMLSEIRGERKANTT